MGKGIGSTVKLGVVIGVILLAGIALMYVIDVFESAEAKRSAVKAMWIVGIFTATSLVISFVASMGSGSSQAPSDSKQ